MSTVGAAALSLESPTVPISGRLNTAVAYLTAHRSDLEEPASNRGFARLLDRLDLLAQVVLVAPNVGKSQLYVSPALAQQQSQPPGAKAATAPNWPVDRELIPTAKPQSPGALRSRS